jgi:hypothetical protein
MPFNDNRIQHFIALMLENRSFDHTIQSASHPGYRATLIRPKLSPGGASSGRRGSGRGPRWWLHMNPRRQLGVP